MTSSGQHWIELGRVRSVHPQQRQIRVDAAPGGERELSEPRNWVHVRMAGNEAPLRCKVERIEQAAEAFVVTFAPVVHRDNIGRMKRAALVLPEAEQRPRSEHQWNPRELVGMQAIGCDGQALGRIATLIEHKGGAVLNIATPQGHSMLVPLIESVVHHVDWPQQRLVLNDVGAYAITEDGEACR